LIGPEEIENIAIGAAILGTGGGGDPYVGKLMALRAIEEHGPVRLLDPLEVPASSLVIPTAMMGAPTVMVEKIPRGDEVIGALKALEQRYGQQVFATMSCEAGGINSTIPISVAARLHIPLVDGDGMGRAFPEIQMVSFHLHGVTASPMAMADEKGNAVLIEACDNYWVEKISRAATVVMGGSAMIALYAMKGSSVKKAAIPRTISLASTLGRVLRDARANKEDPIQRILKITNGLEVFKGKIVDVERRTEAGFAKGTARFDGVETYTDDRLLIRFQNENLIAIKNDQVIASVPDLITILDAETGLPITTEGLKYGYRVVVIGMPCHPMWRTTDGLAIVGPQYFGYDVNYVPLKTRMEGR
jgi:DUF917 family protein